MVGEERDVESVDPRSDGSERRALALRASPSIISITMAGLPSSSPASSNHSGAGSGTWPPVLSEVSRAHSWARSVSMIAWPGGGSARTM
jgi:hypothetical protein